MGSLLMIEINEGTATLIAAVISAFFSLLTYFSTKPIEIRAANRKTLEKYLFELSDSIHQLIATSNILLKEKREESQGNWIQKADQAKLKLKEIRPKIRYSLWGIDKHLLLLARLPDYTLYTLNDPVIAKKIVKVGTGLGNNLDKCIRLCYLNGRSPYFYEIWILNIYGWYFEKIRSDFKSAKNRVSIL